MITSIVDTFNGLPLHVFVVHGAVMLVPLAALSAIALLKAAWRPRLVRLVPALVLVAWLLVWLGRASGEALATSIRPQTAGTVVATAIHEHEEFADQLNMVLFALLVLVVIFALVYSRLSGALALAFAVVIALVAVGVIASTAVTGEQGARAVWNPDGSMSYQLK